MMNFKNLNQKIGFAFIELMIAIAILAIFGTSLFMTQARIFSTVTKAHKKFIYSLKLQETLPELTLKKITLLQQKKSLDQLSLKKDFPPSPLTVSISLKKISEKSSLPKNLEANLQLIDQSILEDEKIKDQMISFLYIPPVPKQEEKAPAAQQTVPKGAQP